MKRSLFRAALLSLSVLCSTEPSVVFAQEKKPTDQPQPPVIFQPSARVHPVIGYRGMVATQEALATRVAAKVLADGGNAVDAAVTAGFALAVTLPRAGNIGGGGFMLVHLAGEPGADRAKPQEKKVIAIDYRETAPGAATRDLFLDESGKVDARKSRASHAAVGVPGTVRGLALALEKFGTFTLAQALEPAIELAENGYEVSEDLHSSLEVYEADFSRWPAARAIFLDPSGKAWSAGKRLVQKDLARSLRLIAEQGTEAFYEGTIAELIVSEMKKHGGLITREDLRAYRPVVRKPVIGNYRGHHIFSMPPPSSGGVHLIQMLNLLEEVPLSKFGRHSAASIHHMTEAMRIAYADRSRYLGDPDFVTVPVKELISKDYARKRFPEIRSDKATPSDKVIPGLGPVPGREESPQTTHFSVMDRWGNVVTNTTTLNFSYGTRIVAEGTGILLNNEMDDFSAKPGVPNAYGLLGGTQNQIEPGKRMLSSMTPTLVFFKDGRILATGSPGGSRIITTVLQVVVNMIDHGMNVAEATHAPRIHHQWLPDRLLMEKGFSKDTQDILESLGHHLQQSNAMGSTQSILRDRFVFYGSSDPRRPGALTIGVPKSASKPGTESGGENAGGKSGAENHGGPDTKQR